MGILAELFELLFDSDMKREEQLIEDAENEIKQIKTKRRLDKARITAATLDLLATKIKDDIAATRDNAKRITKQLALLSKLESKDGHPVSFAQTIAANIKAQEDLLRNDREGISVLQTYLRFATAGCCCRDGKVKCVSCRGTGEKREKIECSSCGGDGWNRGKFSDSKCDYCVGGYAWSDPETCRTCVGTGWVIHKICEGTARKNYKKIKKVLRRAIPDIPKKGRKQTGPTSISDAVESQHRIYISDAL